MVATDTERWDTGVDTTDIVDALAARRTGVVGMMISEAGEERAGVGDGRDDAIDMASPSLARMGGGETVGEETVYGGGAPGSRRICSIGGSDLSE